jgi:1,4-dihydroxy-6-naphthoate synthase
MTTPEKASTKLTLGFSPCPNDTFIFDALVHGKIDTEGLSFELIMEDVEALNKKAFQGNLDISKLSFATYIRVTEHYVLLDAGAALGNGVGPLLISKKIIGADAINNNTHIAIPGKFTTANFLLTMAFPNAHHKTEIVFNDIESAVLTGMVDAGLIIHENRFTYKEKGLHKIMDLGAFWEKNTGMPIPLGGIAVRRNMPFDLQQKINRLIKKSVEYAFSNPDSCMDFVKKNAQEMNDEVMQQHINLYVNAYSVDLGSKGRQAVETFFARATELGMIPDVKETLFLNENQ